jgi:predicted GNAT family N-acyltransferase
MNIRLYNPADLNAVIEIFRSNIPRYFTPAEEAGLRGFLADDRGQDYYVLEVAGEVVGAGGIGQNADKTVSLCWGMVHSDYLGTGLGKRLTEFRIALAAEKYPGSPLVISTSQHTTGFYEKYGFRITERTTDGFGPGIDDCKMRLDPEPAIGES